jgi:hypothetical protein
MGCFQSDGGFEKAPQIAPLSHGHGETRRWSTSIHGHRETRKPTVLLHVNTPHINQLETGSDWKIDETSVGMKSGTGWQIVQSVYKVVE